MSRPEAAAETNMEDILASIRKIIAEEPHAAKAPQEARDGRGIGGLDDAMSRGAAPGAPLPAQSPSGASLAGALRGASTAPSAADPGPAAVPEPKAPLDGLDDLLDDVPALPLRPTAGAAHAGTPSQPAALTTREAPVAQRSFEELLRERPSPKPAEPSGARAPQHPSPFDLSPLAIAGRAAAPPAGAAKPSADLGAIVPSRAFDEAARGPAPEVPAAGDPFRWPGPKLTGAPDFLRKTASAPEKTIEEKSVPPGAMAAPATPPAEPAPTSRYEVIAAMPPRTEAAHVAGADKASPVPFGVKPPEMAFGGSAADTAPAAGPGLEAAAEPAEPAATPAPAPQSVIADPAAKPDLDQDGSLAGESPDSTLEAVAIESTAAAASALGALAAGLAASSKSFLPPGEAAPRGAADPVAPADAAPAAVEMPSPAPAVSATPQQPAPSTADVQPVAPSSAPTRETRTLEDTVAEMLRPMLRQWLDDNMPRMVEKALRVEVAEGVLSAQRQSKPRDG